MLRLDPSDSSAQPDCMTRSARRSAIGSTTAIGMSFAVFLWSPGAMANGCDTTPSIGQTIVCSAGGTETTVTVPTGANAVEVVVIGGGGGGGAVVNSDSSNIGGDGGAGARVGATLTIGPGTLVVTVGSGGSGGTVGDVDSSAGGGGLSQITRDGAPLVVAGGGGGGGSVASNSFDGGDGAASDSAPGGAGGGNESAAGGAGGADASGGLGGASIYPDESGEDGGDYGGGQDGTGGLGGSSGAGSGGAGFGGGGGGGLAGGPGTDGSGGGGAGGSYVQTDLLLGSASFSPADATDGAGLGGDGKTSENGPLSGSGGQAGSVTITFIIIPTPSTGSSVAAPRAISLDFTLPTGIECRFDSVEASLGSWIELPSASDCTIATRATGSQPTLLGWATNSGFPVDIAERQVDNGWGAYETVNDDGQLTGVFIPAGGYTLVSNDTNLHPIWAN